MSHPFHRFRPHPWHGLDSGPKPPAVVRAYVEITPFDAVKYEIDKETGYLRVDRPQRMSSQPPTLYGFIPRTLCAGRVAAFSPDAARADGDPLDICVISERPIARAEVLLEAKVIGGLSMLDDGEADDKIIAVLGNDTVWAEVDDVAGLPRALVDRLRHYFATYKLLPENSHRVEMGDTYGRERAEEVVTAAMADYVDAYGVELPQHGP